MKRRPVRAENCGASPPRSLRASGATAVAAPPHSSPVLSRGRRSSRERLPLSARRFPAPPFRQTGISDLTSASATTPPAPATSARRLGSRSGRRLPRVPSAAEPIAVGPRDALPRARGGGGGRDRQAGLGGRRRGTQSGRLRLLSSAVLTLPFAAAIHAVVRRGGLILVRAHRLQESPETQGRGPCSPALSLRPASETIDSFLMSQVHWDEKVRRDGL